MLPLTKILLPVDFSDRSEGAAHYAKTLACRFKCDLTMLHVVQPFNNMMYGAEMGDIGLEDLQEKRRADAATKLNSFLADEFGSLPIKRLLVEGDPAQKIVELAHENKFDVIVLPTHGYGPFRRFILGSVTAKVLHDADCPVFTGVHIAEMHQAQRVFFRSILCAVDLGPQSDQALTWAAQFAAEFQARLSVVHALPPLEGGQARYFEPAWRITLERKMKEQLHGLLERVEAKADLITEHGAVQHVVNKAARQVQADLVVIGRHADSGLLGRLHAHGYAIIRESPSPVVSI
jgi:nucleotide-binding universal stress UspA family protein